VALIPVFITLIGFGNDMRVLSIALASVFPTLIATMDGVRSVDPTLKDVSKVYRLNPVEKFTQVYLPASAPHIFSGIQVSLQVSFIVMIASEMLGSPNGIGALTLSAQQSFLSADMWAGVLLLGVLGFIINKLFDFLRYRILAWYYAAKEAQREDYDPVQTQRCSCITHPTVAFFRSSRATNSSHPETCSPGP